MHFFQISATVIAIVSAVVAIPTPWQFNIEQPKYFFLRANCTHEPWHRRHIVALPTSHQLGLENFTVSPTTPPLKFHPVLLDNGKYALQGEITTEEVSATPYLAALQVAEAGTHTLSMAIVYSSEYIIEKRHTGLDACPDGYECIIDQWTLDESAPDMGHRIFRFAGFKGEWEPFKDAGKEGWHVYWKGNAGLHHPIQLDLIPVIE